MEPNNNLTPVGDNGKTAGIVSYLTIIGWLVAYFAMHNDHKTAQGSYQLRQTLLFYIIGFGVYIIWSALFVPLLFTSGFGLALALNWLIKVGLFVLWLIGFIGAVNG